VSRYVQLAAAHLRKTRETGDPSSYAAADAALTQARDIDPSDGDAITLTAALALARHDFSAALEWAERAPAGDPDTYGVMGDALLELGRYDEAFAAFQQMIDLRPDLGSYSRASYARELTGDLPGAIEAMTQAVEAGGIRGESVAWTRVQLGNLYFITGDLDAAQEQYEQAVEAYPGYVHGLAAEARVYAARHEYGKAASIYEQVVTRYPLPEYVIALGDVYAADGDDEKAQTQYELVTVIDQLYRANGVNTDLELALFFADHDLNLDDALRQARAAYEQRPGVHAADVLAWTLYKTNRFDEALTYSDKALRLGGKDPLMFFHAGMIHQSLGDEAGARDYLRRAIEMNPDFSVVYASAAAAALDDLKASATR
jgi:tetratricopeptide (TPR) repeat protein